MTTISATLQHAQVLRHHLVKVPMSTPQRLGWASVNSGRHPVSYVFVALGKENEKWQEERCREITLAQR